MRKRAQFLFEPSPDEATWIRTLIPLVLIVILGGVFVDAYWNAFTFLKGALWGGGTFMLLGILAFLDDRLKTNRFEKQFEAFRKEKNNWQARKKDLTEKLSISVIRNELYNASEAIERSLLEKR